MVSACNTSIGVALYASAIVRRHLFCITATFSVMVFLASLVYPYFFELIGNDHGLL